MLVYRFVCVHTYIQPVGMSICKNIVLENCVTYATDTALSKIRRNDALNTADDLNPA